jgi:hypothetical protein
MYTLDDLTNKFQNLGAEQRGQLFEEMTKNASLYNVMMPNLPLIQYILNGTDAVPENFHGPIITAYKAWRDAQE